jgi:hypothetical protein
MTKKVSILVLIFIISILIFVTFYQINVLQVFITDKGPNYDEVIFQEPVNNEQFFSVHWIHSVSLRPIIETYKIENNNQISIYEMIFDSFSANLPASPEYNTKWEYFDDHIRVTNYDVIFDAVPVVIGKVVADHTLYYKDKIVPLKDLYKPGGYVKIRVVKMSLLKYLKY